MTSPDSRPGWLQPLRLLARLLSLLVGFLVLAPIVASEDFRQSPTLPALVAVAVCLAMFAAWRWERPAGLVTLLGGPILLLSIVAYNLATGRLSPNTLLAGCLLALPFVLVGWLFVSAAARDGDASQSGPSRPALVALVAIVVTVLLALAFLGLAGDPATFSRP